MLGVVPICDLSVDLAVIYLYPIAESGVNSTRDLRLAAR
jgi:hypothetical protein